MSLLSHHLPTLRAALEEAEADALRVGQLRAQDCSRNGLALPEALRGSLAGAAGEEKPEGEAKAIPLRGDRMKG